MSDSPTAPFAAPFVQFGRARFAHPELQACQREVGDEAAWRLALSKLGPKGAAEAAHGEYAVVLREPGGRTFLAVDRFATQTLCWRVADGQLLASPDAHRIAAAPDDLDPQAIFDYLYFHVIPSPRTVHRGVQRLPAGHHLLFDHGRVQIAPHFVPRFEEPASVDFGASRERFRQLLRDSVKARLAGSGQPACFLSGGTDSSTVAGMICEVSGQKAASYSIGFEAEGYDEMAYARIAAKHFGTEHHEYYVTPADLARGIPLLAAQQDQPFGNSSALPAYYCALRAKEDGHPHMLAGDGGDELFGGNTRYAKQRVFEGYERIPAGLRRALVDPLTDSGLIDPIPLLKKGASYVRQARVPMPDRMQTYNLLHRLGLAEVLTPGFRAQVNLQGPEAQQREVWQALGAAGPMSLVNHMLAYDWRYTLAENDLPKVRGSTRLAGVTVAYPFLDDALLDFSMQLPTHYKLKGFKLRWFFKEALRGFLPDEIITKKKHGFGLPFGVWAVKNPELQALARDSLGSVGQRGVINPAFAEALISRHLPEHPGYYGEMVWILIMLEQWLRQHAPDWKLRG